MAGRPPDQGQCKREQGRGGRRYFIFPTNPPTPPTPALLLRSAQFCCAGSFCCWCGGLLWRTGRPEQNRQSKAVEVLYFHREEGNK